MLLRTVPAEDAAESERRSWFASVRDTDGGREEMISIGPGASGVVVASGPDWLEVWYETAVALRYRVCQDRIALSCSEGERVSYAGRSYEDVSSVNLHVEDR